MTQIGHVLTRESQMPLERAGRSGGIFAPTIRCNNGRFYMKQQMYLLLNFMCGLMTYMVNGQNRL